jgi:hypothetical protein
MLDLDNEITPKDNTDGLKQTFMLVNFRYKLDEHLISVKQTY